MQTGERKEAGLVDPLVGSNALEQATRSDFPHDGVPGLAGRDDPSGGLCREPFNDVGQVAQGIAHQSAELVGERVLSRTFFDVNGN